MNLHSINFCEGMDADTPRRTKGKEKEADIGGKNDSKMVDNDESIIRPNIEAAEVISSEMTLAATTITSGELGKIEPLNAETSICGEAGAAAPSVGKKEPGQTARRKGRRPQTPRRRREKKRRQNIKAGSQTQAKQTPTEP